MSTRELDVTRPYAPDWPADLAESAVPRVHQLKATRDGLPAALEATERKVAALLDDVELSAQGKAARVATALAEVQAQLAQHEALVNDTRDRVQTTRARAAAARPQQRDPVAEQRAAELRAWLLHMTPEERASTLADALATGDHETVRAVAGAPSPAMRSAMVPPVLAETWQKRSVALLEPDATGEAAALELAAGITHEVVESVRAKLADRAAELTVRLGHDVAPSLRSRVVRS